MIKIGMCDDEATLHNQVKKLVSEHDFCVVVEIIDFMSGSELLEHGEYIDILLLDICMPEMDGIEVGHLLKKQHNIGKIIMLTSLTERFQQNEITYISKLQSRTELVIGKEVFQSTWTLSEWTTLLDDRMFFQIHKSYIVNLSMISKITDKIYLLSGEVLPVAKRRKNELLQKYMEYDLRYR